MTISTWFGFGAVDVLNHHVLRAVASAAGTMPLRFEAFLEYASRLRILRRVGGSYVFMHRSMLEHLARQYRGPGAGGVP